MEVIVRGKKITIGTDYRTGSLMPGKVHGRVWNDYGTNELKIYNMYSRLWESYDTWVESEVQGCKFPI
jgi:hypothetical protein